MPPTKLTSHAIAKRLAREFRSGEVVAVGPGLPCQVPRAVPEGTGVFFLSDSGALGYKPVPGNGVQGGRRDRYQGDWVDSDGQNIAFMPGGSVLSLVDLAALIRHGYVDTALVQPAQVSPSGDFVHWTSAEIQGFHPPGNIADLAWGAHRVIAVMRQLGPDGRTNIVTECQLPADGMGCVTLIITDAAVIGVNRGALELLELAPGWRADDVQAVTEPFMALSPSLKEMAFDVPMLPVPNKVYASGSEAVYDVPHGAVVNIDGFAASTDFASEHREQG